MQKEVTYIKSTNRNASKRCIVGRKKRNSYNEKTKTSKSCIAF